MFSSALPTTNPGFFPQGMCYLWNPRLLWMNATGDGLIAISAIAVAITLVVLQYRTRRDIRIGLAALAVGVAIVAGGMSHFMEVWTLWRPDYWSWTSVKMVAALAAVFTAVALPFVCPAVQRIVHDAQLSRTREMAAERAAELQDANARLEAQALALEHARAEADAANRAKSDFLAVMSHELRTPLNAVVGYADLLSLGISGPVTEAQVGQLSRIHASAEHLVGLIDQVLHFAKLDASADRTQWTEIDAVEVARQALALIEPQANAKGLRVVFDGGTSEFPLHMTSDANKVRQMLLNLLSNAVKFTEKGSITLAVWRDDGSINYEVRDTGIGIAPEWIGRIFEPFLQVRQQLTREVSGTGLGLSVVRQLAHLLEADVRVESTPGAGSTFIVTLPLMPAAAQQARGAA